MIRIFAKLPEAGVAFFSFAFHFVWEMLQVPTYQGMADLPHWEGVLVCTQATLGDVGFALIAFWAAALFQRSRGWMLEPDRSSIALFLLVGLALTIAFEFYYTQVTHRWSYSEIMPLVPPFGTGASPLAQWVVIPLLVVELMRRRSV
ncbi:hypothetical protein [Devosia marina]|uniref:Uncharacterized protein n=1 Tax=Devosia marina TaxID=2683198 RepID=A0A7X3FMU4_9HYPH|nr:hypothetical protein [Devosia marina]MVS97428.1 hypothetical protein [Devosia marina]